MNAVEKDFIELTRRAINCEYADDGFFDETNWEEVFELACRNSLAAVLFDAAKSCKSLPEDIRKKWDVYKFQTFMRQTAHFQSLVEVVNGLKDAGIDYAVFKGQAISECYPKPSYRSSCDSDILVSSDDRERATEIIKAHGYDYVGGKEDKELTFDNAQNGHVIELHTTVFENYKGIKIDILSRANLNGPEHRIDMNVNGKTIRTMGVDEHLVYQVYHLIKHFMLEGASVRFFTDFTLFINKNQDKLHYDYFWKWMDRCGYSSFCQNFFTICVRYFGMDDSILKGRKLRTSDDVLESIIIDFIYKGDIEHVRQNSWQLIYAFAPYLVGEKSGFEGKTKGKIRFIFPMPQDLDEYYGYAKKVPILLPIAWMHRAIRRSFIQMKNRNDGSYSATQRMELINSRLDLFSSVGLIDKEE